MDPWSSALIAALDKVRPAVVHIDARTPRTSQIALGTGVMLDHYHIVTSAQIVAMDDVITVKTADGKRRPATCIGIDPLYFLAILKVEERLPFDPATFAPDGTTPVGLTVCAIGYALGQEHSMTTGVISQSDRTICRPSADRNTGNYPVDGLLITSAQIHPGNTGGPLIDLEGRVVGINGLQWQGGMSLALQASVAARVASQIIDHGYAVHPWLGFSGEPDVIDKLWVDLFDLPVDRGVVVQYVAEQGPAERAGLQVRDMVMAVDGRSPIRHVGYIRRLLSSYRHGDKVPLTVLRQGEVISMAIAVEEIPNLNDLPVPGGDDEDDDEE
ncbi:MAG TPA: trypsin-like peptidase domain-containing protein [Symbiobacteriaceae bacterium]|jgi:serine protease Do|nr:trypsin-like peptidase domain-containing protein [Symbiobacteriaceae bacterium]